MARLRLLGVPDLTCLVNLLVGQANFRGGNRFLFGSGFLVVRTLDLAPILSGVVFVGQRSLKSEKEHRLYQQFIASLKLIRTAFYTHGES